MSEYSAKMTDAEMSDADNVKEEAIQRLEELIESDPKSMFAFQPFSVYLNPLFLSGAINQLREFLKGRERTGELDIYQERAVFGLMRAYANSKYVFKEFVFNEISF